MSGEYKIRADEIWRSFPMVNSVSLGDAMFVEAAARMEFEEFGARLDEWRAKAAELPEGAEREMQPGDMRVLVGLLAAAVSRVERDWTPAKVARFVWDIDPETDLEVIPPEKPEGDLVPLEVKEETPSETPLSGSIISAEDSQAEVPV